MGASQQVLAAGKAGETLTYVGGVGSSTATIDITPISFIAGDVAFCFDAGMNITAGSIPATVVPTGFTQIVNTSSSTYETRMLCSYKILDGTETTFTGIDGTDFERKMILIFRKTNPIATVTPLDTAGSITNATITQTVNAGSATSIPVLVFGFRVQNGPPTFTPAATNTVQFGSGDIIYVAYTIFNASPLDVEVASSGVAIYKLQSFYVTFT